MSTLSQMSVTLHDGSSADLCYHQREYEVKYCMTRCQCNCVDTATRFLYTDTLNDSDVEHTQLVDIDLEFSVITLLSWLFISVFIDGDG